MFRLPINQALKRLRHPLRNPLSNSLRTCRVHNLKAPSLRPESYDAINRHFSSFPDPLEIFIEKKEKEAMERGEFIDVHDSSGLDPNQFDVLITDVDESVLRSDISELVGIPYLKEATKDDANQILTTGSGLVYGR